MNQIRRGSGRPLVLIHGPGGSRRSWRPILDDLAPERFVIGLGRQDRVCLPRQALPGNGSVPGRKATLV